MKNLFKALGLLVFVVIAVNSTLYVVSEFERGVKLRFGKLIESDIQPGLHVKVPFIDDVRIFDARILTVDALIFSAFSLPVDRNSRASFSRSAVIRLNTGPLTS